LSLGGAQLTGDDPIYQPFREGMRRLGWVDGRDVAYVARHAQGQFGRLDAIVTEVIAAGAEVILAGTPPLTRAAQNATRTIPIVMTNVSDAVENGFVRSLAAPGGNITGITSQLEEVLGKLVQIFQETVPTASKIAVLLNENNQSHPRFWRGVQKASEGLGLQPVRVAANAPGDFTRATARILQERCHGIVVVADVMYAAELPALQQALSATRLPVACGSRVLLPAGLLSYGSDWRDNYRHAATFVHRILRGARPADLPVEQPMKFDLAINLRRARALGVRVPHPVMVRANETLE
jgi:putative tryptophan/tyrosine transport system substrate-binding protein